MLEFFTQHQFWTAVVLYWIYSAAVSSLPEPAGKGNAVYLWLYRFSHTIAGNLTTAFGSRIPGLKALGLVLILPLLYSVSACGAHTKIHPGALNSTDSAAYDALLIAETTIDQARLDVDAGQLPGPAKDAAKEALDALVRSYNVARGSWLTYRGALEANVPSEIYFDRLNKNLTDLVIAIRKFEEAWGNRPPVGRPRSGVPIDAVGGPDAKRTAWGDRR